MRIHAQTTAVLDGVRTYRDVERDLVGQIEPNFIEAGPDRPALDRIHIRRHNPRLQRWESVPELVVHGSVVAVLDELRVDPATGEAYR